MSRKVSLVTNATGYAGPGGVTGLLDEGMIVACSDRAFRNEETSSSARHPFAETALYGAVRAATTAYAIALGQAVGPDNIQVDVIGPNWVKNPPYFPDGREAYMPKFKIKLDTEVPLRRPGRPEEAGALIAPFASQRAMPLTAQFISFAEGAHP